MSQYERKLRRASLRQDWSGHQIRSLRQHLKLTQSEMADELQVRQQTISEWETDRHSPHRSTKKILTMIAERAGFEYQISPQADDGSPASSAS